MSPEEFEQFLSEYAFDLPDELIARRPSAQRDASRLLVVDPAAGNFRESNIRSLPGLLRTGDCLVLNRSRVSFRRLELDRSGRTFTPLFVSLKGNVWRALVFGAAKLKPLDRLAHRSGESFIVRGREEEFVLLEAEQFRSEDEWERFFEEFGRVPLPPYLGREDDADDRSRYRTVFGEKPGSLAAPTAGLHFTDDLIARLIGSGIKTAYLDLQVGFGTFAPLKPWNVETRRLHEENFEIDETCSKEVNAAARVIAVGTTTARVLETIRRKTGRIEPAAGKTDLFLFPPDRPLAFEGLLTNFHLPSSSLFMLVCAFAGKDLMRRAYEYAVDQRFRFFSYGDAMLILPGSNAAGI